MTAGRTPALFKSTPRGARDFLVPSRMQAGNYALCHSLHTAVEAAADDVERYQITKCFRRDLRADRQPEFTQVDMEIASRGEKMAYELEDSGRCILQRYGSPTPLRKIQYWDAMDTYGSDKPDTRIGSQTPLGL